MERGSPDPNPDETGGVAAARVRQTGWESEQPARWTLPPLILHPFADKHGPSRLIESSRASLILQGLLPAGELTQSELEERLLEGRYWELRMLFYVGRDLLRWIEQCADFVAAEPSLRSKGYRFEGFAAFLVEHTPSNVIEKLKGWGVSDYAAIFARSLALNTLFTEAPARQILSDHFVRNYYRFADQIYLCRQSSTDFPEIPPNLFQFELYASGEYARMLEREWEQN